MHSGGPAGHNAAERLLSPSDAVVVVLPHVSVGMLAQTNLLCAARTKA